MSEPKLPNWMEDHMRRYLESNGEDGHIWNGIPTLLLTTIGRKTGSDRMLPLIYGNYESSYVVIASKGGHSHHPSWYLNLVANERVKIQVGADKLEANARTALGEEREKLWGMMTKVFPTYDEYQGRTEREIPVVVIDPSS